MSGHPLRQRGAVLWFTGLSGAGKTTLSVALAEALRARGKIVVRLDGDLIRQGLSADLGFSPEDRAENVRRVAAAAKHLADAQVVVLAALISPYAEDRQAARSLITPTPFSLVHVATPLETCEARDPKGLYARARAGEIAQFTGISAPYEAPTAADLELEGSGSLDARLETLLAHCRALGLIER